MIRLGSLAGYPFEGPRLLAGWTPPACAAVYAIAYKPEPEAKPDKYAVIYVGHSDDLSAERFPFQHPRAHCWVKRAGSRWKVYICTYEVPGGGRPHREQIARELTAIYQPRHGRTSGSAGRLRPPPAWPRTRRGPALKPLRSDSPFPNTSITVLIGHGPNSMNVALYRIYGCCYAHCAGRVGTVCAGAGAIGYLAGCGCTIGLSR